MKKSLCFALIFMALWSFSLPLAIGWVDRGKEEIAVVDPEGVHTLIQPGKDMKICTFLWVYYGYPS